jgi:hypothetical protein
MHEFLVVDPPVRYHDNEDVLAEAVRIRLGWDIQKMGSRWAGAPYLVILEQGAIRTGLVCELVLAAAGRVIAARKRGQMHFDDMEFHHRQILADVIAVILFCRYQP